MSFTKLQSGTERGADATWQSHSPRCSRQELQQRAKGVDTTTPVPIALVDDDPLYRELVARVLAGHGYAVHEFSDGRTFLDAVQALAVRLVLLDWTMPAMSGLEVLRTLRQRQVAIPVVFLTGRCRVEYELAALRGGAIDFVNKARGTEVLAPRLRRLIARPCERPEPVCNGDLVSHPGMQRAQWRGHDVGLTVTEYKVVCRLVAGSGEPVTFRAIYDEVHYPGFLGGSGANGYEVNVRAIMKKIRRKFAAIDPGFNGIRSTKNVGYLWTGMPHKEAVAAPVQTSDDLEQQLRSR
jgi:two-component system, OmpR family, response regulator ChvI